MSWKKELKTNILQNDKIPPPQRRAVPQSWKEKITIPKDECHTARQHTHTHTHDFFPRLEKAET